LGKPTFQRGPTIMTLSISTRILSTLSLLALMLASAAAQELSTRPPSDSPDPNVAERVRVLESELERQNSKLDQLQKILLEQQQTIQALIEKLSAEKTSAAVTAKETETPATVAAAPAEPQTPSVEQRLAKVEGQALKIGPVRFSGDFRVRFDGTFRRATEPPDPPLEHLQNARARYRLRLNFDTDIHPNLSFHGQLATGPLNNGLSTNQDFTSLTTRAPISLSEAWIEYRPSKSVQLQAGRLQDIFADNSRFLFDDDLRFNGFNEKYVASFKPNGAYLSSLELRAGQYILSTPNVAVIAPNSPLARAGDIVGTTGRSASLFHQGLLANQTFNKRWNSQIGADIQLYRHPNHIQLGSTAEGLVLLVQPGLGIALSGPLPGTGTATTTPGGAMFTAPGFQVARLTYRLNYAGFTRGDHAYPVTFNVQLARNVATGLNERDAMLAALQVGRITKRGDTSFLYLFTIKGANALISQLTDDDLGTNSGVNIRTSHFRFEYGISRKVTFQSLFFLQNSLRRSGQYPNFFVPLGDFAPRTYRTQQQLVFTF
ncbi:MAG TPA: putative porin, partial [Pyrinomonadaceae bacterium]|nr:putative porin [Pyrinomonadaceae bacterium]